MALVQTTLFAHPIEVPDDEIPVLRAQGLLSEVPGAFAAEGERRYPVTEVPDQTPAEGVADKPAGPDAGAKPDAKETK